MMVANEASASCWVRILREFLDQIPKEACQVVTIATPILQIRELKASLPKSPG